MTDASWDLVARHCELGYQLESNEKYEYQIHYRVSRKCWNNGAKRRAFTRVSHQQLIYN